MGLQGFKIFSEKDRQIQTRIRLLYRIPHLRICLILRVLSMITEEVSRMMEHRQRCSDSSEQSAYCCEQVMLHFEQTQASQPQAQRLQKTTVGQTIAVGLTILEQLQESL